ncbi:ABC transporter B family member 25 [Forsythia ovata]|uniref:ABC transporter B family member 25 n=1 Tax=Forsythia ovata TaxID=205694 RepID=A0ABD1RJ73_9LAMI
MQATITSRCLKILNHSIPSHRLNRYSMTYSSKLLNPSRIGFEFKQNSIFTGTRNLSTVRTLWSSGRKKPFLLHHINAFLSDSPSKSPQTPGSVSDGHALFSTESKPTPKQAPTTSLKQTGASGDQLPDTKIIATLAKYLWMKDNLEFRLRVIAALGLLVGAKVPFLFKLAVDWLTTATGNASALAEFNAANSTVLALFASPAAILIGYGIARSGASAFNELRTAVFSKVALRTIRQVSRKVCNEITLLAFSFPSCSNCVYESKTVKEQIVQEDKLLISFSADAMLMAH